MSLLQPQDYLKNYYKDCAYLGIQPLGVAHRYGVNGKIAGNLAALCEIKNCSIILHGPSGCAYHYRYSMRRRNSPVYDLECSALLNKDVIFGGSERLEATLLKALRKEPELLAIIPTCVSDIMGEDIEGIVKETIAKNSLQTSTKIFVITSEAFSHPDKISSIKRLKEKVWSGGAINTPSAAQFKGCGFIESMNALVEQVMEPQQQVADTVNIESFAWGYGGTEKMQAVINMLTLMGIKVQTLIPSASYEQLRQAPKAQLNIVRRIRWAQKMKELHGTDYLHFANLNEWTGSKGIEAFYLTVAEKFDKMLLAKNVLEEEKQKYLPEINEAKTYLQKHTYGLIASAPSQIPEYIRTYEEEYGMPLAFIALLLPNSYKLNTKLDDKTINKMLDNIEAMLKNTGSKAQFVLNPSEQELARLTKKVDCLVGSDLLRFKKLRASFVPDITDVRYLDFAGYAKTLNNLAKEVSRKHKNNDLLLNLLEYDKVYYPLLDEQNSSASREMWNRMWRRR